MIDPLHGDGYAFWSGIGGAALVPIVYRASQWVWPTRCAEFGCYRRARLRHPMHGYPACPRHASAGDAREALARLDAEEAPRPRPDPSTREKAS